MKDFLARKTGQKMGFLRAGFPKEVFFDGTLKAIEGDVLVIVDDEGKEFALSVDKIIMVGPAEEKKENKSAGFI